MDESGVGNESLTARLSQLERERDELRKDIEQLCMQQTGPGYLGVATRMQFQRMVGLEQEVESLQTKLAASIRENHNLQEELSEAYRIKAQLAELHSGEVLKNLEAEKQLKFFQNCVATAFAERDSAIMEAEQSKERVELMPQELKKSQLRIEELTDELRKEKEVTEAVRINLEKSEMQNAIFKEVIDKFYEIRQCSLEISTDAANYEEKCEALMNDSEDSWSFRNDQETSTSNYISSLETEIETLRKRVDHLQNKLKVGLEIESHLKKEVRKLEEKKILSDDRIKEQISSLHHHYSQFKTDVRNLLVESNDELKAIFEGVEKIELTGKHNLESPMELRSDLNESECKDVHVSDVDLSPALKIDVKDDDSVLPTISDMETSNASEALAQSLQEKVDDSVLPTISAIETGNFSETLAQALQEKVDVALAMPTNVSEALAQALQEKVSALLLLSQEEERYLLERNVNVALQKRVDDLQRNLIQVTNEKVKALMELAQLKQEAYMMQDKNSEEKTKGALSGETREQRVAHDKDGILKNMLKRSYLTRWVGGSDVNDADAHSSDKPNLNMDLARMRIEYATLKESLESMEHLLSSVRRLRMSLFKVKDSAASSENVEQTSHNNHYDNDLDKVVAEAKLLMTALSSSLPISWSAAQTERKLEKSADYDSDKVDFVSAVGLEMIELILFAAEVLRRQLSR